jgi:antitoxin component HigA of HigAB toxin-antitoxin module
MKSARLPAIPPRRFIALTALRARRPIRDEADLRAAQRIADRLAVLDRRTRDQDDYLQTLSLLIEAYEDRRHAIDTRDLEPITILRSLMESQGMSASQLGRVLGNRSLGPAILRGDRQLSKANILALCEFFAVGPVLFLNQPRQMRQAG